MLIIFIQKYTSVKSLLLSVVTLYLRLSNSNLLKNQKIEKLTF